MLRRKDDIEEVLAVTSGVGGGSRGGGGPGVDSVRDGVLLVPLGG